MNHKLTFLLSGALALSVLLTACGDPQSEASVSPSASSDPSPSVSDSANEPSALPESPAPSQDPSEDPAPSESESSAEDLKELAMTFIGEDVEDLIAAIGEPTGSDYSPSCLGSGDDGELFYDGFSVYTYREGDSETVQDVL